MTLTSLVNDKLYGDAVIFLCRLHDDADEVMKRLSSTFSAETNKREDEERMLVQLLTYFSLYSHNDITG